MKEKINVRYFAYDFCPEDGHELVEVEEYDWLALPGPIVYKRYTLWANGVDQICLTKECDLDGDDI